MYQLPTVKYQRQRSRCLISGKNWPEIRGELDGRASDYNLCFVGSGNIFLFNETGSIATSFRKKNPITPKFQTITMLVNYILLSGQSYLKHMHHQPHMYPPAYKGKEGYKLLPLSH
jgi:hypothetical protein